MYLSRLILDPKNRAVHRAMADCQQLHRTVLSAFPDLNRPGTDAREQFGVLHRLDINPRTGTITLLVQSCEKPEWSHLPHGYLFNDNFTENPAYKSIDEQYNSIRDGDILVFRLRANPTKKVGTTSKSDIEAGKQKSNGRRVPVKGETAQIEWLKRKASQSGFEVLAVKTSKEVTDSIALDEGTVYGSYSYSGKQEDKVEGWKNDLSFTSVLYEGRLKIIKKELFINVIKSGIGSGKAYGFGLLSIARPR